MALNNQRNFVIAAVVLLLAAVGAAAWIHNSNSRPLAAPLAVTDAGTQYAPNGQPYNANGQPYAANGQPYNANGQSSYGPNGQPYDASYGAPLATSTGDGYYPLVGRPVYIRQQVASYPAGEPEYLEGQDGGGEYTEVRRPGARPYREYHHGRSKKHSIEIVAGTAAAGAAIGAIAGGGKGAAIGGVSGAGAGFAYDRLTHNH
jgi:hypothetical protein